MTRAGSQRHKKKPLTDRSSNPVLFRWGGLPSCYQSFSSFCVSNIIRSN